MKVVVFRRDDSRVVHIGADGFSVDTHANLEVYVGTALVAAYANGCWGSVQVEEGK